jgi:glycosyltransferase involved in cell wall biosynthesis
MKIALIDRALLERKKMFVRGVELFNINLVNDLIALGYEVHLYIHSSWLDSPLLHKSQKLTVYPSTLPYPELLTVHIIRNLLKAKCDKIIIGNVANGLIHTLFLLNFCIVDSQKWILIAHRMPKRLFLKFSPKKWRRIICVNNTIANKFLAYGFENVIVEYGKSHPEQFYPAEKISKKEDIVNFCMLGSLDSPWKGAAKAIEAFKKLPPDIKKRCKLHLASYKTPQGIGVDGVLVYPPIPPKEIPEWLRKMDVMIVASYDEEAMKETFCMAMIEGMLTALPVLVSSLPVLTEKITEGGGRVFNSEDELSAIMKQLVLNPEMRRIMGAQARAIALKRYIWDTASFASRYLET